MSFKNKVVLVTGASSGIGAASALHFASEGADVVIVGRNETKLRNICEKCEERGKKPLVIVADVTKDDDLRRIVKETIDHFGKLNVLVNNAGVTDKGSILDEDVMLKYDKMMASNLRSVVYITHLAAPYLIKNRGNIVNVSSAATKALYPRVCASYTVSKAGLDHFTKCVALELASFGVRVNCVNPGAVKTDIFLNLGLTEEMNKALWDNAVNFGALNRISEPSEIADLILYLASEKAKSMTGTTLTIDNGFSLKGAASKDVGNN